MLGAVSPGTPFVLLLACALLCGQSLGRVHDAAHLGAPPDRVVVHVDRDFTRAHDHEHGPVPAGERAERTCSLPDGALSGAAPMPGTPTVGVGAVVVVACVAALVPAAPAGTRTPPRARDPPVLS